MKCEPQSATNTWTAEGRVLIAGEPEVGRLKMSQVESAGIIQ